MPTTDRTVDVAVESRNELGESVVWDSVSKQLVWIDIHRGNLERWGTSGHRTTDRLAERIGAIGLRQTGGLVAGFASGFALLDAAGRTERRLMDVEAHLPTTRLNDGRLDRQGRFVCGGMDEDSIQKPVSAVYRLDHDGSVERIIDRVACANSICFSPDGSRMYFADFPTRCIVVYEYDADAGIPHDPVIFADGTEQPGYPDGSTVDAAGCVWNARWGAGRVVRYAPNGDVDAVIELPTSNPTCPAFGGDDLETLFVTSARFGLSEQQRELEPLAGSVFSVRSGTTGLEEPRFGA
jgi:L-arabinonolactonase